MTAGLYTRALNLVRRLTGREAAALRYQRDAHAEEAGRERQRRMEAERERDAATEALRDVARLGHRDTLGQQQAIFRAREYLAGQPASPVHERLAASEMRVKELAAAILKGDHDRGITIWKLQNRLTRWKRRYYQMRDARDGALSQTAECSRQREQKAAEHMWTLREMTDMAAHVKRELDAATALIERLTTARDEHALADAATWLHARTPIRMATEQEGSRGGLAWMPGEALPDE